MIDEESKRPQHSHLRVLLLDQTGELGGAEFSLLELCELAAFVATVVLFRDGPLRTRLESLGLTVRLIGSETVNTFRKARKPKSLWKIFVGALILSKQIAAQARTCDVVYANTQKAAVIGALAGKLSRRPVVWYLHDIVNSQHFEKRQLFIIKVLSKYFMSEIVCNSEATKRSLMELSHLPTEALKVVYNGISSAPFDRLRGVSKSELRTRYGIPEHAFLVGCFSRLALWKGQHVLLDAIAMSEHAHAVLVGGALFDEEAYEAQLREQARMLQIEDRIHFLGFQSEIPSFMHMVDAVAHTSIAPEPFGRVIVEGLLAQRPVIATRGGGASEILRDRVTGLVVEPGDADGLHDAISALLNSKELVDALVTEGYRDAKSRFGQERFAKEMTEILLRQV